MTNEFTGLPPEYRPLADEAMRLAASVQDWVRRSLPATAPVPTAGDGGEHVQHAGSDCAWCPLCQFVAVLRGDRPEVSERVAEAGTAFVSAVRVVIEAATVATSQAASAAGHARAGNAEDPDEPSAPRVQRINLGDVVE